MNQRKVHFTGCHYLSLGCLNVGNHNSAGELWLITCILSFRNNSIAEYTMTNFDISWNLQRIFFSMLSKNKKQQNILLYLFIYFVGSNQIKLLTYSVSLLTALLRIFTRMPKKPKNKQNHQLVFLK